MAQLVKNPPTMWETWVLSLGWEDPLEEGMAIHSSIWNFLIAHLVKNLPVMQETWIRFLGGKSHLEKGMATHSSILENSMDCIAHGVAKSRPAWMTLTLGDTAGRP